MTNNKLYNLHRLFPHAKGEYLRVLADNWDKLLTNNTINTDLRIQHFLAQCAHETGGFRWVEEDPTGRLPLRYEGRLDLGNRVVGDGWKYRGRGVIQLTGRYNYKYYGTRLGYPYEETPDMVLAPYHSWLVATEFWKVNKLNVLADKNDIYRITKRINGGTNGLESRKKWYQLIKDSDLFV